MIIYFTGTGNSQFVAEGLAIKLNDEVVDSLKYIKTKEKTSFISEKPWVFVFPIYLSTVASIFVEFIKTTEFKGSRDAYFIGTCASKIGSAPNYCKDLCQELGFVYKGTGRVQMPQNYVVLFNLTPDAECDKRLNKAYDEVERIAEVVKADGILDGAFKSAIEYKTTKMVERWYNHSFTKTKKFYSTNECSSCGMCSKLCPTNTIVMENGKPKWTKNCIHCMSCINRCPKRAIEYGKGTLKKGRYICKKYSVISK